MSGIFVFDNPDQVLEIVMPTIASEGVGTWTRAIGNAENDSFNAPCCCHR